MELKRHARDHEQSALSDDDEALAAARVEHLYRSSLPAYIASPVFAGLLMPVLWNAHTGNALLAWFAAMLGVCVARAVVHALYLRTVERNSSMWERRFALGALAAGAVWSLAPVVFFPDASAQGRLALFFVIGGALIGAAGIYSSSRAAYLAFVLPSMAAATYALVHQPDEDFRVIGTMLLLFAILLVLVYVQMRRSVLLTLSMRIKNQALTDRLGESDALYRYLVETSNDLIWSIDLEGRWTYLNGAAVRRIWDAAAEDMLGKHFSASLAAEVRERDLAAFRRIFAGERLHDHETRHLRWDGSPVDLAVNAMPLCDAAGRIVGATGTARDVTERNRRDEELRHFAYHDTLTDLPNRRLLEDRLKQAFFAAQRRDERLAVMVIDLDHFKDVNDSLGHDAGDAVLREVAIRLAGCVRKTDTLARQGGDEFVIVIPDLAPETDCALVAEKILGTLGPEFRVAGRAVSVGASIGISLFPSDAADGETLMRNADTAMYRAKELGRNNYRFYAR